MPITKTFHVVYGTHDASERLDGTGFNHSSPQLNVASGLDDADRTVVGLRFENVTIQDGSTVLSAKLRIQAVANDDARLTICAEDSYNPVPFNTNPTVAGRLAGRTLEAVDWVAQGVGVQQYVESPDLQSVVGSIVARPDWASHFSMVLFLIGCRSVYADTLSIIGFEFAGTTMSARLDVTYEPPAP